MKVRLLIVVALLFLILCEVILREGWGFCDTVLMQESERYEYIAQPNQDRMRFRHHVIYNSLSMRSSELQKGSVRILGLGDSVINGGVLTDQDSLATTLLSSALSDTLHQEVQILNISAGSWGPDNCNAYLEEKGYFDAKVMLLVVSSHDAYDNMDFKPTVGVHVSFPSKQYISAIVELFDRYLIPKVKDWFHEKTLNQQLADFEEEHGIKKDGKCFNPGFAALKQKADSLQIPMIIYLHAERSEWKDKKYNLQGQKIIEFAQQENILIIKDLDADINENWYRENDNIHLSQYGQHQMAELIYPYLLCALKN